jgi:hypothetical protein
MGAIGIDALVSDTISPNRRPGPGRPHFTSKKSVILVGGSFPFTMRLTVVKSGCWASQPLKQLKGGDDGSGEGR